MSKNKATDVFDAIAIEHLPSVQGKARWCVKYQGHVIPSLGEGVDRRVFRIQDKYVLKVLLSRRDWSEDSEIDASVFSTMGLSPDSPLNANAIEEEVYRRLPKTLRPMVAKVYGRKQIAGKDCLLQRYVAGKHLTNVPMAKDKIWKRYDTLRHNLKLRGVGDLHEENVVLTPSGDVIAIDLGTRHSEDMWWASSEPR